MISAVSFPSYASEVNLGYGTQNAAQWGVQPITALGLLRPRVQAVAANTTAKTISFTLPAVRQVRLVALVHHNASLAATARVYLFSGVANDPTVNAGTIVYDSGAQPLWGSASVIPPFAGCSPFIAPAPVGARSGFISLSARADGVPWQLGGIEISGLWAFSDLAVEREIGVKETAQSSDGGGGVTHMTSQWQPRTFRSQRKVVELAEVTTTALDFQLEKARSRPFVWIDDIGDASTWARQCWLAHNRTLPAVQTTGPESGSVAFDLIEHLGA